MSKTNQKSNNKKATKKVTKNLNTSSKKVSNKRNSKKTKDIENLLNINLMTKSNLKMMFIVIISFGTLFIFASYAWFSTNLNVKINTFNMSVTKNSGLSISLDGINYDTSVEVSKEILIDKLKETYPNNVSQWAANGLVPVSTNGISNSNSDRFEIYATSGVRYKNMDLNNGYISIARTEEIGRMEYNNFIAFDLFFKNASGSPISDNLYLENNTDIVLTESPNEEMVGLFNSIRVGFLKIGSLPLNSDYNAVQNIQCNNSCTSIIFEPNHRAHTALSIERAEKFGVTLVDTEPFPTYGCIKSGGPIFIADTVSGSPKLDSNFFELQQTMTREQISNPLFQLPSGITKVRLYLWIEGQDIDSLETDSDGAKIDVSINFLKDTAGYTEY